MEEHIAIDIKIKFKQMMMLMIEWANFGKEGAMWTFKGLCENIHRGWHWLELQVPPTPPFWQCGVLDQPFPILFSIPVLVGSFSNDGKKVYVFMDGLD